MYHTLVLKGEELAILGELLHAELAESHVELRHTDSRDYREIIQRRMAAEQLIVDKIDFLLTEPAATTTSNQN